MTRLSSQRTPAQLHGGVREVFQNRVRPPTAERRARRAARSVERSEAVAAEKRRRRRGSSSGGSWREASVVGIVEKRERKRRVDLDGELC